ncbi:MAG: hypothetical protein DRJ40_10080 [Thermoprotei archaeon]|nr:MAG: hypothetical protein DRJ40_10080 [Thermoprotei archaeon]
MYTEFRYPLFKIVPGARCIEVRIRCRVDVISDVMEVIGKYLLSPAIMEVKNDILEIVGFINVTNVDEEKLLNTLKGLNGVVGVEYISSELHERGYCFDHFYYPHICGDYWRMILIIGDRFIEAMVALRDKLGTALDAVLYHIGFWYGYTSAENMKKILGTRGFLNIVQNIKLVTEYFAHVSRVCGWADIEIVKINPLASEALFRASNCWEADSYLQLFGRSNRPVCHMTRGTIAGVASSVLGRDMVCEEIQCRAMGSTHCMFRVKPVK